MGNLKNKNNLEKMKFAALIATAAAVKIAPKKAGLSLNQIKATQDIGTTTEEVFAWFDRDGSGAVDVYEFIFGIGWICGYHEYEPTEEDVAYLMMFWDAVDHDDNDEVTLEEVYAFEEANGY